jgi:DnaJ-class molecular chaperone
MNLNKACINLNITIPFTTEQLKKQYRIMALKNHPDKHTNNKIYYTEKFKEIGESYEYLNTYIDVDYNIRNEYKTENNYNELFLNFLSTFFTNNYSDVKDILETIVNDCHNLSVKMFKDMNKEKSIQIFKFINKYQHILYISASTVEKIKNIINEKIKNDNVIILNPWLEDLVNDNVYILEFEKEKYYVPLWHDEVYYKHKQNDLVVKCIPDLPENISLDDDNNIIIEININILSLLYEQYIYYQIYKYKYTIPVKELKIEKKQKYFLKNKGISHINNNDIYDNTKKSNIIFIITLQ